MIYLFTGEDQVAKDEKIAQLKTSILPTEDEKTFDYQSLHAAKLSPTDLKKNLITLPTVAKKRLIVLRFCEKLSNANKDLILEFSEKKETKIDVILDTNQSALSNNFLKIIAKVGKHVPFQTAKKKNVFDMTNALSRNSSADALNILSELMSGGDHPLQIMGGLVWFWGRSKTKLTPQRFQLGLKALEQADLNIKRSRLKSEHAMEVCVVKLAGYLNAN